MNTYNSSEPINVGCGEDVSIAELAAMVREVVGYKGEIVNDLSKPDGTPRKLLDVSRLFSLGWRPSVPLDEGIRSTYDWYVRNRDVVRS
jgi:GDP-L-fucose synthase